MARVVWRARLAVNQTNAVIELDAHPRELPCVHVLLMTAWL
jgi:hypothetical protein